MYRYYLQSFFILGLLLIPSGCATLSKHECVQGDWQGIGQRDGERGRDLSRFEKHKEACAQYDKTINLASYKKGRAQGLKSYCDVQHQLNLGIDGERYNEVCSGPIVPLLKEANNWGYRGYKVKQSLSESQSQLETVREKMREETVKRPERERLEYEERRLQDEIDRLGFELVRMKSEAEKSLSKKAKVYYGRS